MPPPFRDYLLGCALGDAIGLPFEGRTRAFCAPLGEKIVRGLNMLQRVRHGVKGQVSDDTQLTLVLAESICENAAIDLDDVMRRMSREWEKNHLVGAGHASRYAFKRFIEKSPRDACAAPDGMAGNGAAMRVGLTGLWHRDRESVAKDAAALARLTHSDRRAVAGAVAIALFTREYVTARKSPIDAIAIILPEIRRIDRTMSAVLEAIPGLLHQHPETVMSEIVTQGYQLPKQADPVDILGISGFTPTSVGWALYCCSEHPYDPCKALRLLFCGGGDLDSHASMILSLSCARNGIPSALSQYIPLIHDKRRWKADYIETLATGLTEVWSRQQK
ncbi:MAG: ADP-ribosylglycohydrolase family protein [Candidatus Hydrogenedentota bacterium]